MRSLDEYWGMKTLILGDVNSGKTQITLALLTQIITERGAEVAVFDLAPEKTRGIGGKIGVPPHAHIFYYTTTIIPPRLKGRDNTQVDAYARQNAEAIDGLFSSYLKSPKPVLVINDVSLYLQAGDLNRLLEVLGPSHTAIVNGYYGTSLGRGSFSRREREQMDRLATACDRVIHL